MSLTDLGRVDTICALATAPSAAAIAVVRVSGPLSDAIRARLFAPYRGVQKPFVATLGAVLDVRGDAQDARPNAGGTLATLDEALCTAFPGGQSYTGEPSFELSLHGSPIIVRAVLESLQAAGCRPAEPGEFTMRAVLTGKLDLTRAEAVHDLVASRSEQAATAALRNLRGGIGDVLDPVRTAIVAGLAEFEARMDFPEDDLDLIDTAPVTARLTAAMAKLDTLLAGAQFGRRLTDGARVVLYGAPNAGKSTLLNRLAGEERAIVHHVPGTTRDVLEVNSVLGGVPVTLVDVAGIRTADGMDVVEAIGIERAERERDRADVLLHLVDGAAAITAEVQTLRDQLRATGAPVLAVTTKADTYEAAHPSHADAAGAVAQHVIAAATGQGVDDLVAAITAQLVAGAPAADQVVLTKARQKRDVQDARDALDRGLAALAAGEIDEVVCSELRQAGAALDRLLGKALGEDVLDAIFSQFCIGK